MSKSTSGKTIEVHPDAWARFERAVDVVAKSPPQHKTKGAKNPKKKKPKKRT
jgi:hypothetical protein